MRICGVDYQGSELIPVVLDGEGDEWQVVATKPKKLRIGDIYDTADVRLFAQEVRAFLTDFQIDLVVIKKRAKSGKFGGGAASFRMGGVLQLSTEKPVEFISPQAVTAALRGVEHAATDKLLAYQQDAFKTALGYALSR